MLRRLVHELLGGEGQEVLVHDLDDGPHALHGGPDARADEPHLGDRGVTHPRRPELFEHALGDAHRAAHLGDVLAHDEDVVVLPHRLGERITDRFAVAEAERGASTDMVRQA